MRNDDQLIWEAFTSSQKLQPDPDFFDLAIQDPTNFRLYIHNVEDYDYDGRQIERRVAVLYPQRDSNKGWQTMLESEIDQLVDAFQLSNPDGISDQT